MVGSFAMLNALNLLFRYLTIVEPDPRFMEKKI